MATPPPRPDPPPVEPIDPLVRPRRLPILVPRDLVALDMSSNFSKFWGTKDEDPCRHMERYIERLASSLITDSATALCGFPPPSKAKLMSGIGITRKDTLEK